MLIVKSTIGTMTIMKFNLKNLSNYYQVAFSFNILYSIQYVQQIISLGQLLNVDFVKMMQSQCVLVPLYILQIFVLARIVSKKDEQKRIYNMKTQQRKASF